MSRLDWLLAVVIVAELAGGVYVAALRDAPPTPDLTVFDPLTAADLDALARRARTAADWGKLGDAYVAYGFFPEAEAAWRLACKHEPDNADLAFHRGFALERLGLLDEANAQYRRALELRYPDRAECWYFIGRNELRAENAAAARAAFEQAGRLPAAHYELARLHIHAGELDEALALLGPLERQFPLAMHPHLQRHRVEAIRGQTGAMAESSELVALGYLRMPMPVREFLRLMDVRDEYGIPRRRREATRLLADGRPAEAEASMRAALAVAWEPKGADRLAEILMLRGQAEEPVRLLEEVIERDGPSCYYLARLGDACEFKGDHESARRWWERAAVMGGGAEVRNVHFKLAVYHEKAGHEEDSNRHYARANLADAGEKFWEGKLADAAKALELAVAQDPRLAPAWFYLGEARRLTGQSGARQAYETCLEIDPEFGRAHDRLARLTP